MSKKIILKAVASYMLLLFIISCGNNSVNNSEKGETTHFDTLFPKYANGFYILSSNNNQYVLVLQDENRNPVYRYRLSSDSATADVVIPVRRTVSFSSTHYGFLESLHQENIIKGISGKDYLIAGNKDEIEEIGISSNLNFEKIISLQPQIVFGNALGGENQTLEEKFKQFNILYLPVSEYTEDSPLARAEWIKLFGLLTGKLPQADSIFNHIEKQYLEWKNSVAEKFGKEKKPLVLMSFPYQNTWYVPGGKSFQATFIKDAGGEYIFQDSNQKNSFVADAETILAKGREADFWLNLNHINSKKEIVAENKLFAQFKPFKNNSIYNNNKRMVGMANAYWQTGVVNPHRILEDIIRILHRDNKQNLYYYKKVE